MTVYDAQRSGMVSTPKSYTPLSKLSRLRLAGLRISHTLLCLQVAQCSHVQREADL